MDNMIFTAKDLLPALISFVLSACAGPFLVPYLRKLKVGQTERELGVKAHLAKAGTPTMGGILFLGSTLITCLIFVFRSPRIIPVLLLTLGFGAIGFVDDYLKVVKKRSDGLFPKQKLALQFGVTLIFFLYIRFVSKVPLTLRIPFAGGRTADIGWLAVPLLFFAVIGTVNGVNFTDGLDGLAATVTAVVAVFFTICSVILDAGVSPAGSAMMGGLLGFLLFNAYPAKVFMGDTGSLALGGFVAGMAYMLGMPLYILIVGLIYLIEVLSVMLQVSYFKLTHGKRIFKMSPIHHHFELCGWSETQVVARFAAVTVMLVMIGFLAL